MAWNPAWANAIASIESRGSGGYSAVGPTTAKGNRAYGKYQVMDFNIPTWTEKHLGQRLTPEQFLASPEAQDAVFQGEFGSSVQKYGNPQDAASVWFTGRPASQGAGRSDILGTTGADYVNKFNAALGQGPQTSTKGPQMMQEQKPQGLLGSLGIQKRDEAAGGETAQPFYQRDTFKDTAAVLAQGFGRMGIMGMEEIADGIAKQRTEAKAKNKTMEALSKLPNGEHLMRVAEIAGPKAAISLYVDQQRGGGASGVQSSSMLRDQSGVLLTMRDGSIQVKTAGGETLSGQAAMDFVAKSNEAAAEYAATIAGAKVTGANLAEAETGGAAAAATAGGATAGKIQGDARARLAGQRAIAENTISLIDELLVDPALARSTGPIQGRLPNISAGASRVQSKLDQLQGKAFLEAYNVLKGGGQITEVEGVKAEKAMARLQTAQNDEDFVDALNDFKDAVRLGILKLEADAGVGGASALPANNAAAADDPLGLRGPKI